MSRLARATTWLVLGGLAVGAGVAAVRLARPTVVGQGFHTYVYFRDANGLPVGSRVKIAGIVVGEIDGLAIADGQARVSMRLRDDVVLWEDAWAEKKAASPLADNYVELSPGGPDPEHPDAPATRQLRSGEPITRVLENATTDRVLRGLEHAIPRAVDNVVAAGQVSDSAREWVAGPLSERLARLDAELVDGALARPLEAAAAQLAGFDDRLATAQRRVATAVPAVDRGLDRLVAQTERARAQVADSKASVATQLGELRADLDQVDPAVAQARAFLADVGGGDDRSGRLAQLLDDPGAADDLAEATGDLAEAARDLDRLTTAIGLRGEYNLVAGAPRFLVSAEIGTRTDNFYLIEIEKGPWGAAPTSTLTEAPGGRYVRSSTIVDGSRFTAQWGHRFGPLAVRAGLKESMFGVGVDAAFGHGRLRLSADLMESSFARTPRLKLVAALEVFRSIYVITGADDVLIPGADLPIGPAGPVPTTLGRLHYGRDYLLGFELRFTDRDVPALLRLYGAFIASLLG
ncbi:MAG: MlaD family protein [Kofleriaceae bacterium]